LRVFDAPKTLNNGSCDELPGLLGVIVGTVAVNAHALHIEVQRRVVRAEENDLLGSTTGVRDTYLVQDIRVPYRTVAESPNRGNIRDDQGGIGDGLQDLCQDRVAGFGQINTEWRQWNTIE
jgi:hypothetical protein